MKRLLLFAFFVAAAAAASAQAVDATVCDILKSPQSFDGKIVRIKGTVVAGFDQFAIRGTGCGQRVNGIWLAYPEGTKGKAGPAAVLQLQPAKNFSGDVQIANRAPVVLDKSKDFKQFDSLLSAQFKGNGMCLGCGKNTVTATLVGRLDGVADAGPRRNAAGKIVALGGFGNLNAYSARLVLQSVSEVAAQEVDYSSAAQASKGESAAEESATGVQEAATFSKAFGPGNPLGAEVQRAADAFGKEGDKNGVEIAFGAANEAAPASETRSSSDSPDGVIYRCMFEMAHLKGNPLARAILNLGENVANLRTPPKGMESAGLYEFEYRAWGITALGAMASGQKTLSLPGGTILWNSAWPPADRDSKLNSAIAGFLTNEELLSR